LDFSLKGFFGNLLICLVILLKSSSHPFTMQNVPDDFEFNNP